MWSKRLEEASLDEKKRRLYDDEIHTFAKCVVGEAYRFTSDYNRNCEKCVAFANWIAFRYKTYPAGMNQIISEFIRHFNDVHKAKVT